jgi:hypothetical protein
LTVSEDPRRGRREITESTLHPHPSCDCFRQRHSYRCYHICRFVAVPLQAQVLPPGKSANTVTSDSLAEIVKSMQKRYVRESWGERAFECFTDRDLERFHADGIPNRVATELATDKRFLAVKKTIRSLPVTQQDEVLTRAASTYKPTWAQIGKIDRSGQTDAGQQAEKEIAEVIVELVKSGK